MLGVTGVLQTVPSLAMLAVLISLLGRIGTAPALVALTLYALLPIMRNTCTGLAEVPAGLKLAAQALGLKDRGVLAAGMRADFAVWALEHPNAREDLLVGVGLSRTGALASEGPATDLRALGNATMASLFPGLADVDTGALVPSPGSIADDPPSERRRTARLRR